MGEATFPCTKCGGPTIKGFAADTGENVSIFKTMWFDGEPVQASLLGIQGDNLRVDRSQKRSIRGLRCQNCGYLELYAV